MPKRIKSNKKEAKQLILDYNTTEGKTLAFEKKASVTVNIMEKRPRPNMCSTLKFSVVSQFATDKNRVFKQEKLTF